MYVQLIHRKADSPEALDSISWAGALFHAKHAVLKGTRKGKGETKGSFMHLQ
jgi:hypothetical protein